MTKTVVISMHDASPIFQREIEKVMHGIRQKKSFLITPLWYGKGEMNSQFADLMRPHDNLLHGLVHQSAYFDPYSLLYMNKKLSREFLYLNRESTRDKITLGVKLFEDKIGIRPQGFIPPMWYHNNYSMKLLKELGFCYTESWTSFIHLKKEVRFTSYPVSLDYGNNTLLSNTYLNCWKTYFKFKKPQFIRLAIHPSDLGNRMIDRINEMIVVFEDNGYTFLTYSELLNATSV